MNNIKGRLWNLEHKIMCMELKGGIFGSYHLSKETLLICTQESKYKVSTDTFFVV